MVKFEVDSISPIRKDDEYGGYQLKLNASFDTLKEVVFIDLTTGDIITPREIKTSIKSIFSEDMIRILSYNLETVLAEKLETIISRGEGSTRPRDRYDLYTIWKFRNNEVNISILREALLNTSKKRNSLEYIVKWKMQFQSIITSAYQKQLWKNYQKSFSYARGISFDESVEILFLVMNALEAEGAWLNEN